MERDEDRSGHLRRARMHVEPAIRYFRHEQKRSLAKHAIGIILTAGFYLLQPDDAARSAARAALRFSVVTRVPDRLSRRDGACGGCGAGPRRASA